jgi:hypothetical protein
MPNPTPIARTSLCSESDVVFGTSLAASTPISFAAYSLLAFATPGTASGTVSWYGCHSLDGTYLPIVLTSGSPAQTATVAANQIYIAPSELFALPFLKAVTSGTEFTARVILKG